MKAHGGSGSTAHHAALSRDDLELTARTRGTMRSCEEGLSRCSHWKVRRSVSKPTPGLGIRNGIRSDTADRYYRIVSLLGVGGMGEVYRARDTTLGREVAIKVLPARFAADRGRLARFEREARLLATLNHPHIAAIYGFENAGPVCALVLELVEGPTLADRLAEGPLPPAEALNIAGQITEALEAAHEKGSFIGILSPPISRSRRWRGIKPVG